MSARDDEYGRGFRAGWTDAHEYNRRRARLWAARWLDGEHRNDEACPTCLAGWALLDDDELARSAVAS